MTILHIKKLLSALWNKYGQQGDKCGLMFQLADLLGEFYSAEEETFIKPQKFSSCQTPFYRTFSIKKSVRDAQTS